jgi:hypothetical protein
MKARFLSKLFFRGLKTLLNQDHKQNFKLIARSKKIEPPKGHLVQSRKLAIPGTPLIQPLFLRPHFAASF